MQGLVHKEVVLFPTTQLRILRRRETEHWCGVNIFLRKFKQDVSIIMRPGFKKKC